MRFLADESVDGPIVSLLREDGHDVGYIAEFDPGIVDEDVLERAFADGRILLTADKDFGELIFRRKQGSVGVILIRLTGLRPKARAEFVRETVRQSASGFEGAFTVVSPGPIRVRRNP